MAGQFSILRIPSRPLRRGLNHFVGFLSPALFVDYLTPFLLTHISFYVESLEPYHRPIQRHPDPAITYLHTLHERVPGPLLDQLSLYLPLGILLIWCLARRNWLGAHHAVLGLLSARAIMRFVVECIKNRVGRFRPDFMDRCQVDWSSGVGVCTGLQQVVKDGRRSFPSGHSSTAFQGLFFLTLFLAGQTRCFIQPTTPFSRSPLSSRQLRLLLTLSPLLLAGWVAISRLEDHMHHPTDVITGSTIGILSSLFIYLTYFPSPFSNANEGIMGTPKVVYEPKEVVLLDEGEVRLPDEEEEVGGGVV